MGLIKRKTRPLNRDVQTFRDDRLIIAACDDTYAPKQYFNFFELPRVQIHVVPTEDGTSHAKHVLNRLLEFEHEEYDELWIILDTDHCIDDTHLHSFVSTLRDAISKNVKIALSRPCFELWLLLHHEEVHTSEQLLNCEDTEGKLRDSLGEYNKVKLKKEHYHLENVIEACKRAKEIDKETTSDLVPSSMTTRIYLIWEAIINKIPESQLTLELRRLKAELST